METNLPVLSHKFYCICCNIRTNNKKDYNNHNLTAKHSKLTTVNNEETIIPNIIVLICEKCNKNYKSRVGLWKHKKQCINIKEDTLDSTNIINTISNNTTDKDALIIQLLKQNGELQKSLIELSKTK